MKSLSKSFWLPASVCLLSFVGTGAGDVLAGQYPRDFSGDAMQQHESRMPSSPLARFPSLLGLTYWPFTPYPPAPAMSVLNITIDRPEQPAPPVPAIPPAPARFWIARCGTFVQIDVSKADVLEEERKDCAP
jgi:hypothetical protein